MNVRELTYKSPQRYTSLPVGALSILHTLHCSFTSQFRKDGGISLPTSNHRGSLRGLERSDRTSQPTIGKTYCLLYRTFVPRVGGLTATHASRVDTRWSHSI